MDPASLDEHGFQLLDQTQNAYLLHDKFTDLVGWTPKSRTDSDKIRGALIERGVPHEMYVQTGGKMTSRFTPHRAVHYERITKDNFTFTLTQKVGDTTHSFTVDRSNTVNFDPADKLIYIKESTLARLAETGVQVVCADRPHFVMTDETRVRMNRYTFAKAQELQTKIAAVGMPPDLPDFPKG